MDRTGMLVFTLLGVACAGPSAPPTTTSAAKVQQQYDSRYVVVTWIEADGGPGVLAVDFNKAWSPGGPTTLEYKAWIGRGADWTMSVYDTGALDGVVDGFPERAGLSLDLSDGVHVRGADLDLRLPVPARWFVAESEGHGVVRTAHVPATLTLGGQSRSAIAVYEWVRFDQGEHHEPEAAAEARRRLRTDGVFGLYDWIVLTDTEGRLVQISSGTQSADFAYRLAPDGSLDETRDVTVRWTATAYDARGRQHAPVAWLVDVPAWEARWALSTVGEHVGHGEPLQGGRRPIYRQIGVAGRGRVGGEDVAVVGMVESIVE